MSSRLVRMINISVAILVALIAIAIYWYLVRPIPKTSGQISASIRASARIQRDARGVPHIQAQNWQDAIFLQGYVTAQDRLWQMDSLRRFGAGELSEVFGPTALAVDQRSRKMRIRAIAETGLPHLAPEDRSMLIEYARGINYFIDTHRGGFSLEFSLPGHSYDPRPWSLIDSVLIGLVMFRDMTDSSKFEFDKGVLIAQADPMRVRTLFPASQGAQLSPGSNAWAVAGSRASHGKPMLANDPHLAYGIPGTWYLVHLKAPGLNVSGASLPGLPGVVTGHNDNIAWGLTNLQTDVMDLYREQLDERTGRYMFEGKIEQAQLDRQMIGVRGRQPLELDTWVTRHGPVILTDKGRSYSMRWSAADGFDWPVSRLNRAANWQEFRQALSSFWGPGMNFVYADRAGNIGFQAAGRIPIRADGKTRIWSDVPLDGSTGQAEWSGYVPFEQMPNFFNPASGIIATANQKPFGPDFPYQADGSYADRYRIGQIRSRLTAKNELTVDDMLALQKDVYSGYDHFLAREVIRAFNGQSGSDELTRQALQVLGKWNGQMEKDDAAPVITELLSNELQRRLVTALLTPGMHLAPTSASNPSTPTPAAKTGEQGRSAINNGSNVPDILPRPQVIEGLLRSRPQGWVPNDDWNRWLCEALSASLELGRRQLGTPVSKWQWGHPLQWKFAHPIGKELPLLDRFFDIGPVEMSGSGTTVKQTTSTLGPSERMVVDWGDLDHSVQNLPAGESGLVFSGHYKDQWPAYYIGKSYPMEFDRVEAKDTLEVRPQ